MIKSKLSSILITLLVLLVFTAPALAIVTYTMSITVKENGTADYPMLPVKALMDNSGFASMGFYADADGRDVYVTRSGVAIPRMLATDRTMFATPVGLASTTALQLTTNNALANFSIITGIGGFITTPSDASIEPGSNFKISQTGWVDTTNGADKWTIYRDTSLGIKITAASQITAGLLTNATDFDPVLQIVANGIISGVKTLQLNTKATSPTVQPFLSTKSTNGLLHNATGYLAVKGSSDNNGGQPQGNHPFLVSSAGTLNNLKVALSGTPGGGESGIFRLWKNNATTDLTCTIADGDSTGSDLVHTVSVVPGDLLEYKVIGSVGCNDLTVYASMTYVSNTNNVSVYSTHLATINPTTGSPLEGSPTAFVDFTTAQSVIPTSGIIGNLYVHLPTSVPGVGNTVTTTLYLNGFSTPLSCTISGVGTDANDTVNWVAVSAGDSVQWMSTETGVGVPFIDASIGCSFAATVAGETLGWIIAESGFGSITTYCGITGDIISAWSAEPEVDMKQLGIAGTIYNQHILSDADSVSTFRKNGGNTTLTTTVTHPATTGHDTTHTIAINDGDYIATQIDFSSLALHNDRVSGSYVYNIIATSQELEFWIATGSGALVLIGSVACPSGVNNSGLDWVVNRGDVMPYITSMTFSVPSTVETLKYEPNALVDGATGLLPDRTGTNDGTISWGANPAGVTVTLGSLTPPAGASPNTNTNTSSEMVGTISQDPGMYISPVSAAVPGTSLDPIITDAATASGVTGDIIWRLFIYLACLIGVFIFVFSLSAHLSFSLFGMAGVTLLFNRIGVVDLWVFLAMVIFGIVFSVLERKGEVL